MRIAETAGSRVDEDLRVVLVHSREDGVEGRVAEVHAVAVGHETEAVGAFAACGFDLGERAFDVGEREGGEVAEVDGVAALEVRCEGVDAPGEGAGGCVVAGREVCAWGGDGEDGAGYVE